VCEFDVNQDPRAEVLKACRDAREKAVISVFLDAGARISEAQALKVTDVLVDYSAFRQRHQRWRIRRRVYSDDDSAVHSS
jgi:integrase